MFETLEAITQNGGFVFNLKNWDANTRCVRRFGGQTRPDYSKDKERNTNIIDFNLTQLSYQEKEFIKQKIKSKISSLKETKAPDPLPNQWIKTDTLNQYGNYYVCLRKNRFGGCDEYQKNPAYPSIEAQLARCRVQVRYEAGQDEISYLNGVLAKVESSPSKEPEIINSENLSTVGASALPLLVVGLLLYSGKGVK